MGGIGGEKIFLSVIIPAYNAAGTLRRCVESADAALADIAHEIIVVDDCSGDRTFDLLNKLVARIPDMRAIRHGENKGLGRARNSGTEAASGEYLWFVDADDEIPRGALNDFDARAAVSGADVVIFKYSRVTRGGKKPAPWINFDAEVFASRPSDEFTAETFPEVIVTSQAVWNKWFRRESVKDAGMDFPDGITGEDLPFTIANIAAARNIKFIGRSIYVYHEEHSRRSYITDERRLVIRGVCDMTEKWLKRRGVSAAVMTSFYVRKAHFILLNYRSTDEDTRKVLRETLDDYLSSLSKEMTARMSAHRFLDKGVRSQLLTLHGLDAASMDKALNLWGKVKNGAARIFKRRTKTQISGGRFFNE